MLVLGPHALIKASSDSNLWYVTGCDTVDFTPGHLRMSQTIFVVGAAGSQPFTWLQRYAAAYSMVAMLCSSLL